jgi:7,8-dihydroneopterin aldolase/epimerase/oxygenase
MATKQQVTLRGMRFHALVGILPHEREVRQPIEIDLTIDVVAGDGVVDYRGLYDVVAGVAGEEPIDFLEEIGGRVASRVIASHTRIRRARVAVRKPNVALGGPLEYAEFVIEQDADA